MEEHADDVHRLLAELTDEPAAMPGCSMGAAIGLHLALHHPGQISWASTRPTPTPSRI
jgi:pimeloyl-ACP methyl ester carboxylesterase